MVLVPWVLRWILRFDYARRDLHYPIATNFFVTMPVATVILGTNLQVVWGGFLDPGTLFALTLTCWGVASTDMACCTL